MKTLPLTLIPNNDGTYTVLSNVFNIVSEGDTMEEAIANGKEALICHIEGLKKDDPEFEIYNSFEKSINTFVTI